MLQIDKPENKRKKSLIDISASGLKDAAKTMAEIAPDILSTVGKIAAFATALI